jgi:hypothetical protein
MFIVFILIQHKRNVVQVMEKPSILLSNYNFPANEKIMKGYIFVDEGLVEEVGEGEPPEDLKKSDIHLPGHGALLIPGHASMVTHLQLHPLRGLVGKYITFRRAWEIVSRLSLEEATALSLNALKILLERGITAVLSIDPLPEASVEAFEKTGLRGLIVSDRSIESGDERIKVIEVPDINDNTIFQRIEGVGGETIGLRYMGYNIMARRGAIDNAKMVGVGHNKCYDVRGIASGTPWELLQTLSLNHLGLLLGKRFSKGIEKRMPADLYTIHPLSGLIYSASEADLGIVLECGCNAPYIETVIVDGEILLDGGQQLVVKDETVKRALRVGEKVFKQALG